jgi:hypothetical protein
MARHEYCYILRTKHANSAQHTLPRYLAPLATILLQQLAQCSLVRSIRHAQLLIQDTEHRR